jgi:hypothetical protein
MKRLLQSLFTLLLSWLAMGLANAQPAPSEWSSAPCSTVALGPGSNLSNIQRTFNLAGKSNTIQYRFFADDKCTLGLFTFVLKGGIDIGKPVADVEGAVEVNVALERVLFTLDSPRGGPAAKGCGDGQFELGVQRDVTESGCLFIKPKATCGVDYDIMKIKDGMATPGFRTANMCKPEGRPTALQTTGARFLQQFAVPPAN